MDQKKTMNTATERVDDDMLVSAKQTPFWRRLVRRKASTVCLGVVLSIVALAILAPVLPIADPDEIHSVNRLVGPGEKGYVLGADELGRDVMSRLIWGARVSLMAGFGASIAALIFGGTIGLIAGFFGRWIDSVLMRATDVILAFPSILLAVGVVAALGPGLNNAMIAVSIAGFPLYARVVRGSVLSARENTYVEAARSIGVSNFRIMWRHILPNILAPIIVALSLDVGIKIVITSSLSFLGLGAQPPTADWGNMIASGKDYIRVSAHLVMMPGFAIFLIALCLNVVGDQLRDILDPRLKNT